MIANQFDLNKKQISSFGHFLTEGADGTLYALENLFGLDIDSSDSSIEITPILSPECLRNLGNGTLYTVSSAMLGEIQGSMLLLLRAGDFQYLGEIMRPVLNLLFLSDDSTELARLENEKPGWMQDGDLCTEDEAVFRAQMMDMLAEMGNVLIGLYTKAIYDIYALNTHHSVPLAFQDDEQETIRKFLAADQPDGQMHLVIENEFTIMDQSIKLWCLISPSGESFRNILKCIESREECSHNFTRPTH
ncbi:MAG: chemotaxis protein CheY-P-specific phosphatase CheC [Lysobacterales bacterium]|jgi:chemotaxis protein CheY-P-specific phosphatase CheC